MEHTASGALAVSLADVLLWAGQLIPGTGARRSGTASFRPSRLSDFNEKNFIFDTDYRSHLRFYLGPFHLDACFVQCFVARLGHTPLS